MVVKIQTKHDALINFFPITIMIPIPTPIPLGLIRILILIPVFTKIYYSDSKPILTNRALIPESDSDSRIIQNSVRLKQIPSLVRDKDLRFVPYLKNCLNFAGKMRVIAEQNCPNLNCRCPIRHSHSIAPVV